MQAQIKELSDLRQELWKKYQDSWVAEAQKYDMEEPKEIDILGENILTLILQNHKVLPVDFVIEELTKLGHAPSLVYDDNGHFAISGDGYASVSDEPQDAVVQVFITKSEWKRTIREALEHYLFNRDDETIDDYEEYLKSKNESLDELPDDFFAPDENNS